MFYMEETKGGFRKASKLEATTLTEAKQEAEERSAFHGTLLRVGDEVENGYISHVLSTWDGYWDDAEYHRSVPVGGD